MFHANIPLGYNAAFGSPFAVLNSDALELLLKSPNKIPSLVTWSVLSTNTQALAADLL